MSTYVITRDELKRWGIINKMEMISVYRAIHGTM